MALLRGVSSFKAQQSLAEAGSLRRKEQLGFESTKEEQEKGIESIEKAVVALKQGMAPPVALKSLERGRQELLELLQGGESYVPQGLEVLGMLKQMAIETRESLREAEESERKAVEEGSDPIQMDIDHIYAYS